MNHLRSGVLDHPGQYGETPYLLKTQKISWAWWRMPVIPAAQEAEGGELPEPRRRRLCYIELSTGSQHQNKSMPNCRVYCRRPQRTHVSPTRGPVKEGDKTFYARKITLGVRGEDGVRGFRYSEGRWIQITFWAERRVRGFQIFRGPGDYLTF